MDTYKIVRFFFNGQNIVIKKGLSLEEAQVYCKDLETSSRTAKSKKAKALTKRHGEWFDGYTRE